MLNFKSKKTYIIAEAGVNHNGNLQTAKKLIKEAKKIGVDAIKFQIFKADDLVTKTARKAPYQIKNTKKDDSQYQMIKGLELKYYDFLKLNKYAKKLNIDFISSVFDEDSLLFFQKKIKGRVLKIPSGEITNFFLLNNINLKKYKVILSTGMSSIKEIMNAAHIISKKKIYKLINGKIKIINKKNFNFLKKRLCILQCVTDYPVKDKDVDLKCINTLKREFCITVGYSDHSKGILASVIAAAMGAKIIEKHFTLDKKMKGPDHAASLNPKEFSNLVFNIRKFEIMEGDGIKKIKNCEIKNKNVVRKSLVAKKYISVNEKFSFENLTAKRPGYGLPSIEIKKLIKKKSDRNYKPDDLIK